MSEIAENTTIEAVPVMIIVISHNIPLSDSVAFELGAYLFLSDNEAEEETQDVPLTNEDGDTDDSGAAGTAHPVSETSSPHGRGCGHSRETGTL